MFLSNNDIYVVTFFGKGDLGTWKRENINKTNNKYNLKISLICISHLTSPSRFHSLFVSANKSYTLAFLGRHLYHAPT